MRNFPKRLSHYYNIITTYTSVLEHAQNQALRLVTGAVKTTPIDAMLFTTGNKLIQELIKEKKRKGSAAT